MQSWLQNVTDWRESVVQINLEKMKRDLLKKIDDFDYNSFMIGVMIKNHSKEVNVLNKEQNACKKKIIIIIDEIFEMLKEKNDRTARKKKFVL